MLGGTADIRDWRHQDRLIVSTPAFYFYSALCPCSESFAFRMPRPKGDNGCLRFTLSFRKIRLESKWNTTFWVVPAENFREQRNIWKGSPVFPDGIIQTEISVQIFFNDFFDTSFRLPRTQTSLFPWKCAPKGRWEGDNVCTLPMVPYGASPVTRVSRSPLRCEKRSTWGEGWVSGLRSLFSVNGSDL